MVFRVDPVDAHHVSVVISDAGMPQRAMRMSLACLIAAAQQPDREQAELWGAVLAAARDSIRAHEMGERRRSLTLAIRRCLGHQDIVAKGPYEVPGDPATSQYTEVCRCGAERRVLATSNMASFGPWHNPLAPEDLEDHDEPSQGNAD